MKTLDPTSITMRPSARPARAGRALLLVTLAAVLAGCGDDPAEPEEARPHDTRTFAPADAAATTFDALAAAAGDTVPMASTSRYAGVLDGAPYRIEVPANWNGMLVMYAHGYAGTGSALVVQNPSIRRHLIQQGYAWGASAYSRNYYDVRAGVEDTNALALAFNRITAAAGRTLPEPTKRYIIGHSMGGHIAGAAVEAETLATARNVVRYQGAVPMCGVMGDTELFNQFAAMQVTAQALTGHAATPVSQWSTVSADATAKLFTTFPSVPTALGTQYLSVLQNITGGPRPLFADGIAYGGSFPSAWGTFGSDGTVTGILTRNVLDTRAYTYTIDGNPAATAALNAAVQKITPEPDANRARRDGLRWIPAINGEFNVPVVTIHTLGDLFVPFSMQQTYARRAAAKGSSQWLVQRAIRGASHCDFTSAEQVAAFEAMTAWEQRGIKPAGDDVLTAATVAQPSYGCTFTNNTLGPDESGATRALRPVIVARNACPAP